MPHINVSMYPGRDKELKQKLAENLAKTLMETLGSDPSVVSVSIEDIPQDKWGEFMDTIKEENKFIDPYK